MRRAVRSRAACTAHRSARAAPRSNQTAPHVDARQSAVELLTELIHAKIATGRYLELADTGLQSLADDLPAHLTGAAQYTLQSSMLFVLHDGATRNHPKCRRAIEGFAGRFGAPGQRQFNEVRAAGHC